MRSSSSQALVARSSSLLYRRSARVLATRSSSCVSCYNDSTGTSSLRPNGGYNRGGWTQTPTTRRDLSSSLLPSLHQPLLEYRPSAFLLLRSTHHPQKRSFSSNNNSKDGDTAADIPSGGGSDAKLRSIKKEFSELLEKTIQSEEVNKDAQSRQEWNQVVQESREALAALGDGDASAPPLDPPTNDVARVVKQSIEGIQADDDLDEALRQEELKDARDRELEAQEEKEMEEKERKEKEAKKEEDDDEEDENNIDWSKKNPLANMGQPDLQHRSTNIGIPPRPEDPIPEDGRTVQVMFCYSKYEIMEGARFEDNVGQFHCPLDYQAIKKEALEFYGEDDNAEYFSLEYYHNKRWHLLDDNSYDILRYYHEIQTLHKDEFQTLLFIRLPFMYDTSDYPEENEQGSGENFLKMAQSYLGKKGEKPKPPPSLRDKIDQYLQEFKDKQWKRSPTSPDPLDPAADITQFAMVVPPAELAEYDIYDVADPVTASTRAYLLQRCNTDYDLRDVLFMQVGALNHMVRVLHYDLSWPEELAAMEEAEQNHEHEHHEHNHHHEHHHEHGTDCAH